MTSGAVSGGVVSTLREKNVAYLDAAVELTDVLREELRVCIVRAFFCKSGDSTGSSVRLVRLRPAGDASRSAAEGEGAAAEDGGGGGGGVRRFRAMAGLGWLAGPSHGR